MNSKLNTDFDIEIDIYLELLYCLDESDYGRIKISNMATL